MTPADHNSPASSSPSVTGIPIVLRGRPVPPAATSPSAIAETLSATDLLIERHRQFRRTILSDTLLDSTAPQAIARNFNTAPVVNIRTGASWNVIAPSPLPPATDNTTASTETEAVIRTMSSSPPRADGSQNVISSINAAISSHQRIADRVAQDRNDRNQRRLAGINTPPLAATSANRVPVISRRRTASNTAISGSTPKLSTYSKPFPIPNYLLHSNFSSQFFTTPAAESLFAAQGATPAGTTPIGEATPSGSLSASSGLGMGDLGVGMSKLSEGLGSGVLEESAGASQKTILLPTCWDESDRCALIEVGSDGLGASFAGSGKYGDRDAAAVRTNRPVPYQAAVYYFEVAITDKGKQGYIGIGLSHRTVSLSRLPGWEANSWGYHGDDGFSFSSQGTGKVYGPTFGTGDVIGCGVDYTGVKVDGKHDKERPEERGESNGDGARCFFTKNGVFLGYAFSGLHGKLYPSVGLRTPGEIVRANFGSEPFVFDIDSLVLERKRAIVASLEATTVPDSLLLPSPSPPIPRLLPAGPSERLHETLQSLISAYLVHHGYTASAHAFAKQLAEERVERSTGLVPPGDIDMDFAASSSFAVASGSESLARGEIRQASLVGDMERAIALTQEHYPAVLAGEDESGGMLFKLRCRAFVEAAIKSGLDENAPRRDLEGTSVGKGKAKVSAFMPEVGEEDVQMESGEEEHFSTPPLSPKYSEAAEPSHSTEESSGNLDMLLEMGRALFAEYGSDTRPAVQQALELTFSVMAYSRPQDRGGKISWLFSSEAREALADELNSAILVSQSLPPMPQLESLVRHANATTRLLGDTGHGGAALLPYPFLLSSPRPSNPYLGKSAAKKVRKFGAVKRMMAPTDMRLKANQEKAVKKEEEKKAAEVNHVAPLATSLFLSHNEALVPPYRVLVDTNFINLSLENRIDLVKGMMDTLYAKCIPCISDCVMAELEKLGQKYRLALRVARDPRFERLPCSHKGTYADDCIVNRVTSHRCYIVATCDRQLRRRLRKVPGVPLLYIAKKRYAIERLPDQALN